MPDTPQFDKLIDALNEFRGDGGSSRINYSPPNMAHYHLTLDGKEYVVAVIPTDLTDNADLGEDEG